MFRLTPLETSENFRFSNISRRIKRKRSKKMGYLQLFYKVMCPKKYIQTYASIWFFNKRFPLVLPANDVKN